MAFGVTSEGFKAKKYDDIINDLGDALKTQLGIDIDSAPDSIAKVLTSIYALALSEEWALPQALQSMFDIDKAEGKHLDDLVGLQGVSRLGESASSGRQYVTADSGLVIPVGSVFSGGDGIGATNNSAINVTLGSCVECKLLLQDDIPYGGDLSITINGITTTEEIYGEVGETTNFLNNINIADNNATASWEGNTLHVVSDTGNHLQIGGLNYLGVEELVSFGNCTVTEIGAVSVEAGTIVIPPNISGIISTTNPNKYTTGRLEETDQELRIRYSQSLSRAGSCTVEAIKADLLAVDGVSTAFVIENDTLELDNNNIPAKAFLSIVKGGSEQDIGDALWLTKPAGIQAYGEIGVTVVDSEGNNQVVFFSRPAQEYIHMRVDYTVYSEESDQFPTKGEDQMKEVILSYGETLGVGEDVIPQRFSSQIFQNIGGLQRVDIYVGSTVSPNDPTPTLVNVALPIDALSEASFDADRITLVEV